MTPTDHRNDTFITRIYRQSREFEQFDINLKRKSYWQRNIRYFIAIPLSALLCILLPSGYPDAFLEMTATILSVLIGLLLTALVFALDKTNPSIFDKVSDYNIELNEGDNYRTIDLTVSSIHKPNAQEKLWLKQSQFYIKKFNVLTGKNVITSLWALALISISMLFPGLLDINLYEYVWTTLTLKSFLIFTLLTTAIIIRFFILYFLIEIFYDTINIIASLVNFMSVKIQRP